MNTLVALVGADGGRETRTPRGVNGAAGLSRRAAEARSEGRYFAAEVYYREAIIAWECEFCYRTPERSTKLVCIR